MKFIYCILLLVAVGLSHELDLGQNSVFYDQLAKMDYDQFVEVAQDKYPHLKKECQLEIAGKLTSMVSVIQARLLDTNILCEEKTKFFAYANEMIDHESNILQDNVGKSVVIQYKDKKNEKVTIQKDTIKKVESLKNEKKNSNCELTKEQIKAKDNIKNADTAIDKISQEIQIIVADDQCLILSKKLQRRRTHRPPQESTFSLWKLLGISSSTKIKMVEGTGSKVLIFLVTLVVVILIVSLIVAVFAWIIAHWYVIVIGLLITGYLHFKD